MEDLVKRLRIRAREHKAWTPFDLMEEAADRIEELERERDEALRRRDAWKTRAEGHVEMVNALRATTAGKDSRTLSRALLGAAKLEAEARADRLSALLKEAEEMRTALDRLPDGFWQVWTSCSFRRITREGGNDGDVLHARIQGADGWPDLSWSEKECQAICDVVNGLRALLARLAAEREAQG